MDDAPILARLAASELRRRADTALARLAACTLCARRCGADRIGGIHRATCRTGARAAVASWGGVEGDPLLEGGADILFAGCNLRCLACSTWAASWDGAGDAVDADGLADILLAAQDQGRRMVVLSSPSHVPAQILDALCTVVARGFRLKLAWATGLYDSLDTLALLDGVIDLYIADFKHGDGAAGRFCTGVADYPDVAAQAVAEMHRQVGPLRCDAAGRAVAGLLVRHLVLPNDLAGSAAVFARLPPGTAVQVLESYTPQHRASRAPKLNRRPSADEVAAARVCAKVAGLRLLG
ncbi:MAG: radical SAM protein [Bacteroidota bacterium]